MASQFWNVCMTIGTVNKVKNPSDRLGGMIGSFSMQWSSFCLTPLFFFLSHTHSPYSSVSNTASLSRSLWGVTDFNFTSSEKLFQTDQTEVTTAHLSPLPLLSAGCWQSEFVFLLRWLSQVPLECTLSESKGLVSASYHIPSLWHGAWHTLSS